ncbi:MAG: methyltransferase domain-containing protein [Methanoregula sp.]|jgi:trans-aconitate methyltransferase
MPSHDPPQTFRWDPALYQKNSSAQQQWAEELIAKLGLRGNERVLDIGCGDGKVTAEIARRLSGGAVVGVDSSAEMIRFASGQFPPHEYPYLSFAVMDAQALTFCGEFDLVFSNAALHWVSDHRPVLAGIERSLRRKGRLLVQMGGRGNAAQVFLALDVLKQESPWSRYFEGFTFTFGFFGTEEYQAWLRAADLVPVRVELIKKEMVHRRPEEFAGWVRTTWHPYLQRVPEELHTRFIDALYQQYCDLYPPDQEGAIRIGMVRLEVEAIKP